MKGKVLGKFCYICFVFWGIWSLSACGSSKQATALTAANIPLQSVIEKFIDAVNQADSTALRQLYADDYRSLSPVYEVSKTDLIRQIAQSAAQKQVKASILELETGQVLSTVILDWQILNTDNETVYRQQVLQIWKRHPTGWKLKRTLFYSPEKVPRF